MIPAADVRRIDLRERRIQAGVTAVSYAIAGGTPCRLVGSIKDLTRRTYNTTITYNDISQNRHCAHCIVHDIYIRYYACVSLVRGTVGGNKLSA